MLKEVKTGVRFVTDFLSRNDIVPQQKIEQFSMTLEKLLCSRYDNHWFPNKPNQGSGYRCIRITQKIMDPEIEKAANLSGVSFTDLQNTLPKEFTMWIDPEDVSYRIGEDGSICTIDNEEFDKAQVSSAPSSPSMMQQRCQSEVHKSDFIDPNKSTYGQCWS